MRINKKKKRRKKKKERAAEAQSSHEIEIVCTSQHAKGRQVLICISAQISLTIMKMESNNSFLVGPKMSDPTAKQSEPPAFKPQPH